MVRRSPEEVYASLLAAGWPRQAAVTMTAIAGAESGWDPDALGDLGLQGQGWGPSFGLFQIRTRQGETGTGTSRDIARLSSGDVEQARAAWQISQQGADFSPWSVYSSGAYQQFLPAAQRAAAKLGDGDGPLPTLGPGWLPWNWPSVIGNEVIETGQEAAGQVLGGVRHIALEGVAVVAGLGLVVAGLVWLGRGGPGRAVLAGQAKVRRAVIGT